MNEDATPKGDPEPVTTGLGIQVGLLLADGTKIAYSKGGRYRERLARPDFAGSCRGVVGRRAAHSSTRPGWSSSLSPPTADASFS